MQLTVPLRMKKTSRARTPRQPSSASSTVKNNEGHASQPARRGIPLTRPNWSRPLPRPLVIPEVMKLVTLADVRELIDRHLPAHYRDKATWRVVAKELKAAALGADPAEVSIALRMALSLEGVECQPT
jgi:hypothetical protein